MCVYVIRSCHKMSTRMRRGSNAALDADTSANGSSSADECEASRMIAEWMVNRGSM